MQYTVADKIPKINDSSATSVRIDEDSEPIAHFSKKVTDIYTVTYQGCAHSVVGSGRH